MRITTIGPYLAKSIFQVHGTDTGGQAVVRKKLRRAEVLKFFRTLEPCLIGKRPARGLTIGRAQAGHAAERGTSFSGPSAEGKRVVRVVGLEPTRPEIAAF
jgi:transposase